MVTKKNRSKASQKPKARPKSPLDNVTHAKSKIKELKLDKLIPIFNDIRSRHDEKTIEKYASADKSALPSIKLADCPATPDIHGKIIDGVFLKLALIKKGEKTGRCEFITVADKNDALKKSLSYNTKHGKNLSHEDMKKWALRFKEEGANQETIASLLSISQPTVSRLLQPPKSIQVNKKKALQRIVDKINSSISTLRKNSISEPLLKKLKSLMNRIRKEVAAVSEPVLQVVPDTTTEASASLSNASPENAETLETAALGAVKPASPTKRLR